MENKNPYQPLIEIIDVILRKIENPPPNTENISLHPSDIFLFKNKYRGYEEMYSFLDNLKRKGVIKGFQSTDVLNKTFYVKIIDINKRKLLEEKKKFLKGDSSQHEKSLRIGIQPILIKDARLDESNYFLEINNGEKIISFKSKKKGSGLEKETKQFKVLYHLWDFRWELKDSKVLKKGDYASLDSLARGSGSESKEAAYKHIQRLNNRFKNEGVAIEIKGENEKYRLIINKA